MQNTNIEWCDHTFNGWTGCTKVSPGCANCYAEGWAKRSGLVQWGKGNPRRRTSASNWNLPLKWNKAAEESGTRPRVFCSSLADWLDDEVPIEWLAELLDLIRLTPNLDWLLLTKRPENWHDRLMVIMTSDLRMAKTIGFPYWLNEWTNGNAPANVWIGTTVENQAMADKRTPELLNIPARIRFLSCEPLLGFTDIQQVGDDDLTIYSPLAGRAITDGMNDPFDLKFGGIHWIIAGGESGPKARPMHPLWVRALRDQAQAAKVPFLFKQWGEFIPTCAQYPATDEEHDEAEDCGNWGEIALHLDGTISPDGFQPTCARTWLMERVGKKAAGRLLDGVEWTQFPTH